MSEEFMLMEGRTDEDYVESRSSPCHPANMALALANFSGTLQKLESETPNVVTHDEPFPPGTSEFPCGMQVTSEGRLEEHDLFYCRHMNCSFRACDRPTLEEHEKTHTRNKVFQCDVCHMRFTLLANMQRHKLSHFGVRPFECRLCPKRFFRKDHLMEHLVRQHSKQRPYRCPFCIKSFNSRPHLKTHLSSEHSGATLGKVCNLCGYRASTLVAAKAHYTSCHLKVPPVSVFVSSPLMQQQSGMDLGPTLGKEQQLSPETLLESYPARCSAPPMLSLSTPAALGAAPPEQPIHIYPPVNSPSDVSSSHQRPFAPEVKHEQPDVEDSQSTCSSSVLPSSTMEPQDGPSVPAPDDDEREFKPCHHRPDSSRGENGDSKVTTSFRNAGPATDEETEAAREDVDVKPPRTEAIGGRAKVQGESSGCRDNDYVTCVFCGIVFPDRTLYFLHRGLHSTSDPWKCNLCGEQCRGKYDFNSHLISQAHR